MNPSKRHPVATPPVPEAHTARVGLSCTADVVGLVPYLLGYWPEDRLVLVVISEGRVAVTLSLEMAALGDGTDVAGTVFQALGQCADPVVVAVAWTSDEARALQALEQAAGWLDDRVADLVRVGPQRWCSVLDETRHGATGDLPTSAVAAQAVVAGLRVAGSRADAVACLDACPDDDDAVELLRRREAVWLEVLPTACDEVATGLQRRLVAQGGWTTEELADLAVLTADPSTCDLLWLALDTHRAAAALDLWLAVLAVTPRSWRRGPLLMATFAAWLSGNGVLHLAGVERLVREGATDDAVAALDALHRQAVPPSAWARVRAAEVFGTPGAVRG